MSSDFFEIIITQGEKFAIRYGLNRKVSLHVTHVVEPFLRVNTMFFRTCYDIDDAEMIAWTDGNILCHLHQWQHITHFTLNNKKDLVEVIIILKYQVISFEELRSKQRTNPSYESNLFTMEDLERRVSLFINVNG
tara:strand:- start:58 stop:462 length:405 start_codon:yes stop_codon:yes gene_type:complete